MYVKKQIRKVRCSWCIGKSLYEHYHDTQWGVPVYDDQVLFEFLILESAQAGLSWWVILQRRESYRKAFANFDLKKIAKFTPKKIERLMKDTGIIRNRAKIIATIHNAERFMEIQKEFGSFSKYLWNFVGGKPIDNHIKKLKDIMPMTTISDALTKDLKKRGFKFLGSTTVYAYMQACGLVNDHVIDCFRYKEVLKKAGK